jgi:hypothetical protein
MSTQLRFSSLATSVSAVAVRPPRQALPATPPEEGNFKQAPAAVSHTFPSFGGVAAAGGRGGL